MGSRAIAVCQMPPLMHGFRLPDHLREQLKRSGALRRER